VFRQGGITGAPVEIRGGGPAVEQEDRRSAVGPTKKSHPAPAPSGELYVLYNGPRHISKDLAGACGFPLS
jgi:hypothetical protein